jgi:hypothetical protein
MVVLHYSSAGAVSFNSLLMTFGAALGNSLPVGPERTAAVGCCWSSQVLVVGDSEQPLPEVDCVRFADSGRHYDRMVAAMTVVGCGLSNN